MANISAVVITHNEEDNIKDCLQSISWAEEIIVIDAHSDDSTVEIPGNLRIRYISGSLTISVLKKLWFIEGQL
jgi:GT2 family glycosyltransferase